MKSFKAKLPSHFSFVYKLFVPWNQFQISPLLKPRVHKHPLSNLKTIDIQILEIKLSKSDLTIWLRENEKFSRFDERILWHHLHIKMVLEYYQILYN